jgi:hypothetical protein
MATSKGRQSGQRGSRGRGRGEKASSLQTTFGKYIYAMWFGKILPRTDIRFNAGWKTPRGRVRAGLVLTDYAQGRPRVWSQSPAHVFPPPAGTGRRASPGVDLCGLNAGLRPGCASSLFDFLDVRSCGL